jgi:L-cysteine:1D-myo-inositol 2-amino-2-deoxy-alpha-D-glucopyranoside ligase
MAIRLALLDGHYRADREWTGGRLPAAETRLARWRAAVALPGAPAAEPLLAAVRAALANDLDTVATLVAIDAWAADATGAAEPGDPDSPQLVRRLVDALLGVAL